VRRGDHRVWMVHAADGDVDRARPRRLAEGERRAAGGAQLAGVPAVKAKAAAGNVAQVTNGAPVVRRQMLQWQWFTSCVVALTR